MRKKRATNENFRLNILIGFFLSVSVVFVLRLFFIQVVGHEK